MPRTILNTNEKIRNKAKERELVKRFFKKIKVLNANNKLPAMINVPAPIFKYMALGRYGAETKIIDNYFQNEATSIPYVPDQVTPGDYFFYGLNIDDTGMSVQALNLIQSGAGPSFRIGNKVALKSLRIRLYINPFYTNVPDQTKLSYVPIWGRVMIIYDRQPSGATTPQAQNILGQAQINGIQTGGLIESGIDINNVERYKVIRDILNCYPANAIGPAGPDFRNYPGTTDPRSTMIDEYLTLNDLETIFGPYTPTQQNPISIKSITTGALYILVYGDVAQNVTPYYYTGNIRLTFHDV